MIHELIVIQSFSCFFMTGLIWLIQIVHYPSFLFVEPARFIEFETFHSKKISLIVIPIMLTELATALLLILHKQEFVFIINLILLACIWLSTFFLSVPLHNKLMNSSNGTLDVGSIQKLILTNWPRTILWTIRSFLWLGLLLLPTFV